VWEVGGSGQGFAASLEAGGQLWVAAYDGDPWANPAMAYLKVDVSSYYNTPGTFYTTINNLLNSLIFIFNQVDLLVVIKLFL
jgi:hypothetical protein